MRRPWMLVLGALAACAVVGPVGSPRGGAVPEGDVQVIVRETSAARQGAGLMPLGLNAGLTRAADLTADQMVATGVFAHSMPGTPFPEPPDRLSASGYHWTRWAENLGTGSRGTTAASMVEGWLRSPEHRANIMNPKLTELGVAVRVTSDGTMYFVQEFGRP